MRPDFAVTFDLTRDQPDNRIRLGRHHEFRLGSFEGTSHGKAVVELYGDLKRHRMGAELAESVDDDDVPADTFLTENLWRVGSTAPYMHDGRATTLTEAIIAHGGEAEASRFAFERLRLDAQADRVPRQPRAVQGRGGGLKPATSSSR